jgi:hypothetical protein
MPSDTPRLYIEASLRAAARREKPVIGRVNGFLFLFLPLVSMFLDSLKEKIA